jgi:hypothetical protein
MKSTKFLVNDPTDARTKLDARNADGQTWEDSVSQPNRDNGDHLWVINPK